MNRTYSPSKVQALPRDLIFDKKIANATAAPLEPEYWMTTNEAAQFLRVSISGIKNMIFRGQIRVYKLGRRNRFLREDLDRLVTAPLEK